MHAGCKIAIMKVVRSKGIGMRFGPRVPLPRGTLLVLIKTGGMLRGVKGLRG